MNNLVFLQCLTHDLRLHKYSHVQNTLDCLFYKQAVYFKEQTNRREKVPKTQRENLRLFTRQMITLYLIPFKLDMDACSDGDQRN